MKKIDSFCVIAGMPQDPGCEEAFASTWTRFMQEPAFLYLTGVNQAGCYLLLDPMTQSETLFVPPKDPFREFWIGRRLGFVENDSEVSRLTGIREVRPVSELWGAIERLCSRPGAARHAYAFYFEKFRGDHNDRFRMQLLKHSRPFNLEWRSVAKVHFDLRLPLEKERIAEAKRAQVATDQAFRAVLPAVSKMKNERELSLMLNYEMLRRGDGDLAFPTICAGGENACVLHYVKNDEPLKKNSLILLDFGVRIGTLHSDISRTIPVSGKFSPLQKLLYQIVLDSATEYQKYVVPGVTLKEIGQIPWEFIVRELDRRLVKEHHGKYTLLYDKRPHGMSHFIGEQIHEGDPDTRSLDIPLVPGMLISCEPGLYGTFEGIFDGKRVSQKVGIRIEDDLLITEKGFENLSRHIPKSLSDIERLMK